MGHKLVTEAMSEAYMSAVERDPLTGAEWRVLVVMAHHALDREGHTMPPRIYAAGWRILAYEALCRPIWNATTKRAVARAIAGLTKRGLIREYEDQDNRHKRYVVLPPGVTHRATGGVVPSVTDG